MIIFGFKVREIQIANGQFFCPSCKMDRGYQKLKYARYFTLYFIPLFQTQALGEQVRCGHCRSEYATSILSYSREQIVKSLEPWACTVCGNRNASSSNACLACLHPRVSPPPQPGAAASSLQA